MISTRPFVRTLVTTAAFAFAVVLSAQESPAPEAVPSPDAVEPALPTDPAVIKTDSSFALGYQFGQIFRQQLGSKGVEAGDLDMAAFNKGFESSLGGNKLEQADQQKLGAALQAFDKQLQERRAKVAEANKSAGEKFLSENKGKPGVVTTPSGLQYEVLKEGKGKKYEGDGNDGTQFKVRYEGRFVDGKKFDGDMKGEPVSFTLQVIPGFKEALMAMPEGSVWRLFIPSNLAYGEQGAGGTIPPGSALIFDLELVEIAKAAAATTPPISLPGE